MAPAFLRSFLPKRERSQHDRTFWEAVKTITWTQWALFFVGWLAWTCDAVDFFSVSLSVSLLEEQFGKDTSDITESITLTLLFRSLGAVIFGLISDRYGRKWPLVWNLLLCAILELGSGFVNTFAQFLAVRSLFGIAMGGIWGLASATALESLPVEVRGAASGLIQEGYAVGYLFAAVINLYLVPTVSQSWRSLFWCAAGMSFFAAVVRAVLPESEIFLRAKAARRAHEAAGGQVMSAKSKTRIFLHETKEMLKVHWKLCIYAVLLMSGFNFLSHGSQDLYPTYLKTTKGFNNHQATVATIIGNCGAIVGGGIAGALSQYIGRRLTIIIFLLLIGAFIPLWTLPSSFSALAAGAFCIQVGVQGAWGVIPIALAELSPPAFRGTFPGVAYQLGNMVSSASAQIEATGGKHQRLLLNGKDTPDYAKVQQIFIGIITAYTLILVIVGPENHGSHFEKHKVAFEEGAARDDAFVEDDDVIPTGEVARRSRSGSASDGVDNEKEEIRQKETV
ncbi:MFS general substrate transporter [Exidia glandulosa HHB12029]|uniref:MFS general substrate transporter n=1 Tax=Exidia glandulosa HHB12029 TaxID=1314781 RepID=A0A165C7A5_EXIGL|nr:MFS general substrate transporter [Exidia glandulosa HHB12029]